MAPPRQQRTTTVADDSRSEASSGPRESKTTTTGKSGGRKGANGPGPSSRADGKAVNSAAANVTSAPAQLHQQPPQDLPNVCLLLSCCGCSDCVVICIIFLYTNMISSRFPGPTCPSISSTPTATPTISPSPAPIQGVIPTSSSPRASVCGLRLQSLPSEPSCLPKTRTVSPPPPL